MDQPDVIIIGAGICGLAAGNLLSQTGKNVLILEARNRTGGRVHSIRLPQSQLIEAGAEFIHGDLPLTKSLIKQAKGEILDYSGNIFHSKNGTVTETDDFIPDMKRVLKTFHELEQDMTLTEFLKTHFTGEKDAGLREAIIRQTEGFDVADPEKVSVFALREEWSGNLETVYLIKEGYSVLADYLTKKCMRLNCRIEMHKEVNKIQWKKNDAEIICSDGSSYKAQRVLITVPLGVLTSVSGQAYINFNPAIPDQINAAQKMGYGTVVKVLLTFKTEFWNNEKFSHYTERTPDLGFLINDSSFPVFWVNKVTVPMITGWAGGSKADKIKYHSNLQLLEMALTSLAKSLVCSESLVREQLTDYQVFNWNNDPYSKGAYSYITPQTKESKAFLEKGVENTLFFGGEAFGKTMGTVEAALESAISASHKILTCDL